MFQSVVRCVLLVAFAGSALGGATRVMRIDPVELVAGRETPGRESSFADYAGYRYLFANDANKAAFQKDPARYEIQLGGACARMGPLSGGCSAEIYAVHDGRVYLFASEQCRKSFLANPEKLLESDDAPPAGTPEGAARGRALIQRAVDALGGDARLEALRTYQAESVTESEQGGKKYTNRKRWTIRFPDAFRIDDAWNETNWAMVATPGDAFFADRETRSMHPQQRAAFERLVRHEPLVILQSRKRPDFVALAAGAARAGDADVELLTVYFGGTATTLGIEPQSGRILTARFRGRGPTAALGQVEIAYADFRDVSGYSLPATATVRFDGEPAADMSRTLTNLAVNAELDAALFVRPGS